uniref:Uncharacterized protein n=1 Tax=Oryza punctata TaxID=4537 RepID=A0A0E0KP70_ORYPU
MGLEAFHTAGVTGTLVQQALQVEKSREKISRQLGKQAKQDIEPMPSEHEMNLEWSVVVGVVARSRERRGDDDDDGATTTATAVAAARRRERGRPNPARAAVTAKTTVMALGEMKISENGLIILSVVDDVPVDSESFVVTYPSTARPYDYFLNFMICWSRHSEVLIGIKVAKTARRPNHIQINLREGDITRDPILIHVAFHGACDISSVLSTLRNPAVGSK